MKNLTNLNRLIIIVLFLFFNQNIYSQYIEFGGSLGGTTYQGDISHYSSKLSIQGAKLLNSVHLGYHFNEYFSMKVRYSSTTIGAYDSESNDPTRRKRNLHFKTSINEWAIINDIELIDIIKQFRNFNLKPFISFGASYFKFNPQARYKADWVDLQPLGTEGQGLPGEKKPYNQHQIGLILGAGLKYNINNNFIISFEISPRITFTDYLDDVSSAYPDLALLRQTRGDIAADMSYRSNLLPDYSPSETSLNGVARGNNKDNDWYIFNSFTVAYKFDPYLWMKKRRSFRQGRKCRFN